MNHPSRTLRTLIYKSLLLVVISPSLFAQQPTPKQFVFAQTFPGESPVTWLNLFTTVSDTHIEVPKGVPIPDGQSDSSKSSSIILLVKLKVIHADPAGFPTLQVSYLKRSDAPQMSLPVDGSVIDIGTFLSGRGYEVDCKSGAASLKLDGVPITPEETRFVKRECEDLQRLKIRSSVLGNLHVGERKTFTVNGLSPFSEEVERYDIKTWDIALRDVDQGPTSKATFDVRGKSAAANYEGVLVIDDKGLEMELTLKSTSEFVRALPDGGQIKTRVNLTLQFRQQILQ